MEKGKEIIQPRAEKMNNNQNMNSGNGELPKVSGGNSIVGIEV